MKSYFSYGIHSETSSSVSGQAFPFSLLVFKSTNTLEKKGSAKQPWKENSSLGLDESALAGDQMRISTEHTIRSDKPLAHASVREVDVVMMPGVTTRDLKRHEGASS